MKGLAIFGWKKSGEQKPAAGPGGGSTNGGGPPAATGEGEAPQYQPEKAKRFFEHAKTMQNASNYEYAIQLWLNGLRLDPGNMEALQGFFGSCASFLNDEAGKKGVSKDTLKAFGGKGDIERLLLSLLEWGTKPLETANAVRAVESAAKLNLPEPTFWLGERAIKLAQLDKKPRKDLFVKLMESFKAVGAYDLAVQAGEGARKLDPTDGPLAAEIRNMAAQATMTRGGYDQTGKAGGFRANVRDAEKQKLLEDQDRIVKTAESKDRVIAAAQEDYERRSQDQGAIDKYARALLDRGRPEDEERATAILNKAFEETHQIRWRLAAGEIRLRQAKRKVTALRNAAEANPDDAAVAAAAREATAEFLRQEIEHLKVRAEAYPTDLSVKFELGRRHFHLEDYETAINLFQDAQGEPKNKVASLSMLGQSFLKIGYVDEAMVTFRQALDGKDVLPDLQMELRYWLMTSLQAKAEESKDLASAEEAEKLASAISIQQFNYRDVRQRREAIKKLIASIKGG